MRRDAVDHHRMLAVLRRHLDAELHVGAVVLVREDLADVVQQRAALGEIDVELQLSGHHTGEEGHYFRMFQDVLPVGRPVLHPADEFHQLGMHAANAGVVDRLLAGLGDAGVHVAFGLLDDLLDPSRMDAPIGNEAFERETPDFTPHRLEARHHDGVRGVVDDHVDAGRRLERADVAPLAPDDPAPYLTRGQPDPRYARLCGLLGRDALDRQGNDLLCFPVGVLPGLLRDVAPEGPRFVARLALETRDQLALGLLRGQAGDLFEPRADLLLAFAQNAAALLELLLELAQLLFATVDAGDLLVEAIVEVFADRHELFFGRQHD